MSIHRSQLMMIVVGGVALMHVMGCGPVMSQKDRWAWKAYDDREWTQEHDGIVVENHSRQTFPSELMASAQKCQGNQLVVDYNNQPVMEQVYLPPPGARFWDITITNNTDHVVRMNRAVFRLFDPSGNQYEPLSVDEMQAMLSTNRPCPSTQQLLPHFKMAKFYNRNVEIVPKTSFSGFVVFKPATLNVPGVWKVAIYEIPAQTDEAGKVTKTTGFEVRSVETHYIDHYYQESAFAQPVLKNSEEAH